MNSLNISLLHWIAAGDEPDQWVLLLGCAVALWSGWLFAAIVGLAAWRRPADRVHLLVVVLAVGIASLLSHALSARLHLPRPFMLDLAPAYIVHGGSGSLPSTHASVMFTAALGFLIRPGLRSTGWVLFALAALTGWARIYVGVHFPLDIVAGLALAAVLVGGLFALSRSGLRIPPAALPRGALVDALLGRSGRSAQG